MNVNVCMLCVCASRSGKSHEYTKARNHRREKYVLSGLAWQSLTDSILDSDSKQNNSSVYSIFNRYSTF